MRKIHEPRASEIAAYLAQVMLPKGYQFFDRDQKPYNLNIIGVRMSTSDPDVFDDLLMVVYRNEREGHPFVVDWYPITTEPGPEMLRRPLREVRHKGTAILAPGQYRGAYERSKHRGIYLALRQQKGPVAVYRDNDRDGEVDLDPDSIEVGHFAINIHKHRGQGEWERVGAASAGCQVFANTDDFDAFMGTVACALEHYSNRFTYTLLTAEDVPGLRDLLGPL